MYRHSARKRYNDGQAMLISVLIFVGIGVGMVTSGAASLGRQSAVARDSLASKREIIFTESALEDMVYRAQSGKQTPASVTYSDGSLSSDVSFTDLGDTATVEARSAGELVRAARATLTAGEGNIFSYAVHIGEIGVRLESNAVINGNVYTNGSIEGYGNSQINGDAYAAGTISSPSPAISGVTEAGAEPLPIAGIDVDAWKAAANVNNDPYIGNLSISGTQELGPKKIEGNLIVNGNANLTITGPIYATGNVTLNTNSDVYLDESFAGNGTAIVADGSVLFESNADVFPAGESPKGYLMFIALSSSGSAIDIESNSNTKAGVYAPNGTVRLFSNAEVTSVVAAGIRLESNAELNYDLGIRNINYSASPTGGWTIGGWGEIE